MLSLDKVVGNGFKVSDRHPLLKDVSLLSLRIALESFFETYKAMNFSLSMFKNKYNEVDKDMAFKHTLEYCELCTETVLHFHHFFELTFKEILRKENELLVLNVADKPTIFYNLVKGNAVASEDLVGINTIEFDKTLDRLKELIKQQSLTDYAKYQFIADKYEVFKKLNILRNRLWHRGAYILLYPALDIFIGNHILPLVIECFNANLLDTDSEYFWKYSKLACSVDPITEIITETKAEEKYDLGKVAFLKELGRAAYKNPLSIIDFGLSNELVIARAKKAVEAEHYIYSKSRLTQCPVCGENTLIIYEVLEDEAVNKETGAQCTACITVEAECTCCSFNIGNSLNNASEYSLPIEDYWSSQILE
jgi:hypothetical protein